MPEPPPWCEIQTGKYVSCWHYPGSKATFAQKSQPLHTPSYHSTCYLLEARCLILENCQSSWSGSVRSFRPFRPVSQSVSQSGLTLTSASIVNFNINPSLINDAIVSTAMAINFALTSTSANHLPMTVQPQSTSNKCTLETMSQAIQTLRHQGSQCVRLSRPFQTTYTTQKPS